MTVERIGDFGTAALILLGAGVLLRSLNGTREILGLLRNGRYVRQWRVLFFLMLSFLSGYLAAVFLVLTGSSQFLAFLAGVIFLSGACFVNLVVRVGHHTIDDLLTTTVSTVYFEEIIESMAGALVVTDVDLIIRKVNRATVALSGCEERGLLGRPMHSIFPGCDLRGRRDELLRQGSFPEMEKECRTPSGQTLWVSVTGTLMRDSAGEVEGAVFVFQDIRERKKLELRLYENATHDPLTELPNRALFVDRLHSAIRRARRAERFMFAVLFLDVDRFKRVNDTLGHTVGDELLTTLAGRLQDCIRETDTVARLGGDEFVILLEDIKDVSDAIRVANRIQHDFGEPLFLGNQELTTSASIGIVLSESGHECPEDVLRDADVAMYKAKAAGRAQYEVFDEAMRDRMAGRLAEENELRRAIDRGELQVHYQPIVEVAGGRLVGFEALVRWDHPQRGLVPPGEFVPLAEETGMIVTIDRWVLQEACRQIGEWQRLYPMSPPLAVSVNMSCKQVQQADLVSHVDRILRESGLDPRSLRLEITESAFMENLDSIALKLEDLKQSGVGLSLDDFGKGYSSLSYLHRLPIDTLKIDRSFVMHMTDCGPNLAIVHTIILLARALNIPVVAEGVETAGQLARLGELDCDFVQGYYFSRPVPAADAESLIATALRVA